jgi:hypothetical protein
MGIQKKLGPRFRGDNGKDARRVAVKGLFVLSTVRQVFATLACHRPRIGGDGATLNGALTLP